MASLAVYPLAEGGTNVYHEFVRLQSLTQWWHWLLLVLTCGAALAYVALLYRRDSAELPGGVRWLLLLLRVTAFAGILFFYFDLEKRSEQKVVKNSRTVLLVDTSLSMGIQDGAGGASSGDRRRIDEAIAELAKGQIDPAAAARPRCGGLSLRSNRRPRAGGVVREGLARGRGTHSHT